MEIRLKWSCSECLVTSTVKCNECDIKLESRLSQKSITCSKVFEKYIKSIWEIQLHREIKVKPPPHHHFSVFPVQIYSAWLFLPWSYSTNFSGKFVVHILNVTVSIMLQFMSIRFYNFYYRVHMQNKKEKDNIYVCLMIFENRKTTIF